MLRRIDIANFEGIASGTLDGLSPLVVLVGPNGSGKSTVLDAIAVAESAATESGIAWAQSKRAEVPDARRWMLHRPSSRATARLTSTRDDGTVRTVEARLQASGADLEVTSDLDERGHCEALGCRTIDRLTSVHDPPLHALFSLAMEHGHLARVEQVLGDLVPGFERLALLTAADAQPVVHVVLATGSVPVGAAGRGIYALTRLALYLASAADGVVLLEHPETSLHPATLRRAVDLLVAATERTQVVLATHSLELIDGLVDACHDEALLEKLTGYQLRLDDGLLKSSRVAAGSVRFMRREMETDLR